MTFIEKLFLLDRLHKLILRKGTGAPSDLAYRLEVSERTVYNLINTLRDLGADIDYCNYRCSYYYKSEVVFAFMPGDRARSQVKGGHFFSFTTQYSAYLNAAPNQALSGLPKFG